MFLNQLNSLRLFFKTEQFLRVWSIDSIVYYTYRDSQFESFGSKFSRQRTKTFERPYWNCENFSLKSERKYEVEFFFNIN